MYPEPGICARGLFAEEGVQQRVDARGAAPDTARVTTQPAIQIGAEGVNTEAIVQEILDTVARKYAEGAYGDARIAKAERLNLLNLKGDDDFLPFYLNSLREASTVDINDFDIRERRASALAPLLVRLKKTIWSLLKFYTYRLWSQQNTVNGLLVTGMESLNESYEKRIKRLEARVADLEKQLAGKQG